MISMEEAEDYCKALLTILDEQFDEMEPGDRLNFYGFGTFYKVKKNPRAIGDIRTGETITIDPREKIKFVRADHEEAIRAKKKKAESAK